MSDNDQPSTPPSAVAPRVVHGVANEAHTVSPPRMMLGYNYAWAFNKYGLYFGPHLGNPVLKTPRPDAPSGANAKEPGDPGFVDPELDKPEQEEMPIEKWVGAFPAHLAYLHKKLKISVVRIFLLCNGQNWGGVDGSGNFQPAPYLHSRFRYHLNKILQASDDAGVQLIPSLVDFGIGNPAAPLERRLPIVTNDTVRTQFYDQVLEPLLAESSNFKDVIYAWEVMNEPSWLTARHFPKGNFHWYSPSDLVGSTPLVTDAQLSTFLQDGIARIEKRGFPSTVGHRYLSDTKKYPTGNTPQFHYYPSSSPANDDETTLHDAKTTGLPIPPILGEFGSSPDHGGPWSELSGRDAGGTVQRVTERLKAIDGKHYGLAIIWPDQPDPFDTTVDPLKLSGEAEQGILSYLSSI